MILTLYGVLVAICLVLIVVGLAKPTESAQALIGFFLLFLLALVILNGTLEYETGALINTTYQYSGDQVIKTDQEITNTYAFFNDTTSQRVGYYLAIASAIGFIGVFFALRRSRWKGDKDE